MHYFSPHRLRALAVYGCLLLSGWFFGCVPAYIPPPAHAPLLSDEGEVRVAVHGSVNDVAVQAAVAPIENLGVVAAFNVDEGDPVSKHVYGEAGAGYWVPFGIGRFEAYGGFGAGQGQGVELDFRSAALPQYTRRGTYFRPWAQATIGLATKFFDAAFVNRFQYLVFKWDPDASPFDRTSDAFYYEPFWTIRAGYRFIKVEAQFGLSFPFATTSGRIPPALNWNLGLGISVAWDFWGEGEMHMPNADEEEYPSQAVEAGSDPAADSTPPDSSGGGAAFEGSGADAGMDSGTSAGSIEEPVADDPAPPQPSDAPPPVNDVPPPPGAEPVEPTPTPTPTPEPEPTPTPTPPEPTADEGMDDMPLEAVGSEEGGKKKGKGKNKKKKTKAKKKKKKGG